MKVAPEADYNDGENKHSDEQQSRGLGGIGCVALVLERSVVLRGAGHGGIVARESAAKKFRMRQL